MAPNLPTNLPNLPAPRPTPAVEAPDPGLQQPTDRSSFQEVLGGLSAQAAPTRTASRPEARQPERTQPSPTDGEASESAPNPKPEAPVEEVPDTNDAAPTDAVVAAVPVVVEPRATPVRVPEPMLDAVATTGSTQAPRPADARNGTVMRAAAPETAPEAAAARAAAEMPESREPATAARDSTAAPAAKPEQRLEVEDAASTAASRTAATDVDAPAAREAARQAATDASRLQQTKVVAAGKQAADPLAKLIESARIVVERSASERPDASASAHAIAGRLNDVEVSVARDRAAKAIDGGFLQREGAAAGTAAAAPAATASVTANAVQPAVAPAAPTGSTVPIDAGTAGAAPAPDLALPTEADAHPSAQLAAKGIAILGNQRGGAITMRLEPPALGQLRIELQIQQGAVVADFTAATPEARVLLEANLGMLRERLESQGLSVERISVHGGRGTESASPVAAPAGGDARQEGAGARSDSGDRGDRSGTRQDAAGGESRGRRDGDARAQRDRTDAARTGEPRGFAAALHGETALRTEPMRRAG